MQSLEAVPPLAPARAGLLRGALRDLSRDLASVRENGPLILCTLVYIATVNLIAVAVGVPHHSFGHLEDSDLVFFDICFASLAVACIVWLLHLTLVRGISIRSPEARRRPACMSGRPGWSRACCNATAAAPPSSAGASSSSS